MKKTFELTHPKIKLARRVDAVKHEIKKYLKRERNKTLPQGADFWDFDCKFGNTEAEAQPVHVSQFNKLIDQTQLENLTSFYVEILAKPAQRQARPSLDSEADFDDEE
ncbi:hypothetical protein N474_13260 [Pseudoalteromonas luteoviolacea CPMOR-2]|uniref:Uncharacterized protein n=1 Tax=Pseudoalteromonas luteoviolacea DSM 6061 TaxID=1365250 RepID=A0A166UIN7_9GAMM|nr:DUF6172 family protein [Pseudoalteromonas luteoviolacea]KZN30719.1 hypothetical protein N475_24650 [Pseudoalteromonas luteoviolacea DSM 6061]KZN56244.1 hypothetical protein N474_13260 [Pseudoalteromonas luteoviolacea CPMOR-2]MBE0388424.1 hypothetical protein [Pseudoalteromonas luteoviolacea DSM 6061]